MNAPRAFHSKRFNLEMNAGGVLFYLTPGVAYLRVSALLSAPRCDTTQLLFIPIRLAPIWVIHSGYADPRPRPKCTPQCLLGWRTRKNNGVFRLRVCSLVFLYKRLRLLLKIRNFGRSAFAYTMTIPVSPRYPSHYLYSIHTCACDLCP